ncbi:MAG TPA: dethiobiotin synthase [Deltaproteobacteria bacterium]|nr:dethiobiotin synthase [Deltaproteobacteria bacterium]
MSGPNRIFFITATDTGVGKTFVTASMAVALRLRGVDVGVMKPVESGCSEEDGGLVPHDAVVLRRAAAVDDPLELVSPCRFSHPLAPSIASGLEGRSVDFEKIVDCCETLAARHDVLLIEGVGGFFVPLDEQNTVADLIRLLRVPAIVVAASRLGVINHLMLTLCCAEVRGVEVKAIVVNHPTAMRLDAPEDESIHHNLDEIRRITDIPVIGEVPHINEDDPYGAAAPTIGVDWMLF